MHELSIALSLLDVAAEEAEKLGAARVVSIRLKLGPLSGVVKEALLSAFEMAREDSLLPDCTLMIEEVPVVIHCGTCNARRGVVSIQEICCDVCGAPASEIVSGRELEVFGLEIIDDSTDAMVEVRQKVLKQNDVVARVLRQRFQQAGVRVISLVSSPGSGKTRCLEEILTRLAKHHKVAALVGDLATDNDAQRLARSGVPVRQIVTGTVCHLEADMVQNALGDWNLDDLDFLFIENVGNLVCPASYDLGEALRLVLFSVTEGEDKPLKYPTIFNTADIAVVTKLDLAAAVEFDSTTAHRNIRSVRPGMEILEVSAKTGEGMDLLIQTIQTAVQPRPEETFLNP